MRVSRKVFAFLIAAVFAQTLARPMAAGDAQPEPVSADPQETSAAYGDWVMRCVRIENVPSHKSVCEAAQTLVIKGQQAPVAQIAFGHADRGYTMTMLLPVSITFGKEPTFAIDGEEGKAIKLGFQRCVPAGCIAIAKVDTGQINSFRSAQKSGKLAFTDAAERTLAIPVSFRGLPQALDDLDRHAQ